MNAEMQVLQSLDAAQDAFRRLPDAGDRASLARNALQQVAQAPWPMMSRSNEAEQHGWLTRLRELLADIEREPESDNLMQWVQEGQWCAQELERDLRSGFRRFPLGNSALSEP